jgi:hypothetical protein
MCESNDIQFRIHKKYYGLSIAEIPMETRFADLLLLGGEKYNNSLIESEQIHYITDVLKNTECPVMVIPEDYKTALMNILAYDGSSSSLFAIKQFAYLFPEFCQKETLLVYMNDAAHKKLPSHDYIIEYTAQHFHNLTIESPAINPHKDLINWLIEKPNSLVVIGACGRSFLSEMVKPSFAQQIVENHRHMVFVSHR